MIEGILAVNKPVDFTSHDVVAKVRRILGMKRIGHTGTLDPKVTGVLPLCIGRATRVVEYIQELPKEYEAKLIIGLATDTEDMSGTVTEESDHVSLEASQVEQVLHTFTGEIEQIPPMYSAVKIDGRRLYDLAREGAVVERKARKVTIHRIDLISMKLQQARPEIEIRVLCSKGTYIRTLCADIGRALGYPAVMADLVRTATGGITLDKCLTLDTIADLVREGHLAEHIIPTDEAIPHLPAVEVSEEAAVHALQGKKLPLPAAAPELEHNGLIRLYSASRRFLGIFRVNGTDRVLIPEKVFHS